MWAINAWPVLQLDRTMTVRYTAPGYDTTALSRDKSAVFLASSKAKVDERRIKPADKPV